MQVFKVLLKIIKKNFPMLSIYLIVFFIFTYALGVVDTSDDPTGYSDVQSRVMVINQDAGESVSDGLEEYLDETGQLVAPVFSEEEIRDTLFRADAEYIITIPEGFSDDFLSGEHTLTMETRSVAGSTDKIRTDMIVQKYLEIFRLYVDLTNPDVADDAEMTLISEMVREDLSIETEVIAASYSSGNTFSPVPFYFKFLSYSLLAIMILGVSSIMKVFSERDFKNRLMCSPKRATQVNLQIFLGNMCFAVITWLFFMGACLFMFFDQISNAKTVIMIINAFIFTLSALSLSFLLGQVVKGDNARSAVANVVALGSSFLGGVFVPQALLSDFVKSLASFTPTFWYVLAVEEAKDLQTFGWRDLDSIIGYMAIQICFAIAFLMIALMISRQKKRKTV